MKTDKEPIILTELAADHGRFRAVLREWGYGENEINRVLKERRIDPGLNDRGEKDEFNPPRLQWVTSHLDHFVSFSLIPNQHCEVRGHGIVCRLS